MSTVAISTPTNKRVMISSDYHEGCFAGRKGILVSNYGTLDHVTVRFSSKNVYGIKCYTYRAFDRSQCFVTN